MEVKREPVPADFRVRQLRARDLLRGDLEDEDVERYVEERVMTTTVDKAVGWAQGNSIYPLTFGLACCAIERSTSLQRGWISRDSASRRCARLPGRPT